MFGRIYLILGSLLVMGYGAAAFEGWELGNPVRLAAAPPAGAILRSSSGRSYWYHSSPYYDRSPGSGGFGGK
jgi:hypothetical protein